LGKLLLKKKYQTWQTNMPASDQGVSLERYMLVPRTLIFIIRGNKILLLKGGKNKRLWSGQYNGIGGHVEQGENILAAARRELLEEAGLVLADLWLCGITTVDTQTNPGVCIYNFRGECIEGEPTQSTEGSLEWIQFSDLNNLPLVTDLPTLLPKILGMKYGDPPFFAHSRYDETGNIEVTIG
jgi:8-oxo-dGTP diphosphatase